MDAGDANHAWTAAVSVSGSADAGDAEHAWATPTPTVSHGAAAGDAAHAWAVLQPSIMSGGMAMVNAGDAAHSWHIPLNADVNPTDATHSWSVPQPALVRRVDAGDAAHSWGVPLNANVNPADASHAWTSPEAQPTLTVWETQKIDYTRDAGDVSHAWEAANAGAGVGASVAAHTWDVPLNANVNPADAAHAWAILQPSVTAGGMTSVNPADATHAWATPVPTISHGAAAGDASHAWEVPSTGIGLDAGDASHAWALPTPTVSHGANAGDAAHAWATSQPSVTSGGQALVQAGDADHAWALPLPTVSHGAGAVAAVHVWDAAATGVTVNAGHSAFRFTTSQPSVTAGGMASVDAGDATHTWNVPLSANIDPTDAVHVWAIPQPSVTSGGLTSVAAGDAAHAWAAPTPTVSHGAAAGDAAHAWTVPGLGASVNAGNVSHGWRALVTGISVNARPANYQWTVPAAGVETGTTLNVNAGDASHQWSTPEASRTGVFSRDAGDAFHAWAAGQVNVVSGFDYAITAEAAAYDISLMYADVTLIEDGDMPSLLISVNQAKMHFSPDITDIALQQLIDSADADIVHMCGAHTTPRTVTVETYGGEIDLFLEQSIRILGGVTIDGVDQDISLFTTAYDGGALRYADCRLWRKGTVDITYDTLNTLAQRRATLLHIVEIDAQKAVAAQTVGGASVKQLDFQKERGRVLQQLYRICGGEAI